MGSFLTDTSGKIKIPQTKINLVIRPNKYKNDWGAIQASVSSFIKKWEDAGFKFNFTLYEFRDEINTSLQERFLDDIAIAHGNSSINAMFDFFLMLYIAVQVVMARYQYFY